MTPSRRPATTLSILALAGLLTASAALAQKGAPGADGAHPDLSGTSDTATLTPLERPPQYGDRLYLSPEEAQKIEEAERLLNENAALASDPDREAPPPGGSAPVGYNDSDREVWGSGNVGGYNSFWIDRGEAAFEIEGKFRTSILTDPPNGRRPPMTPEGQAKMAARFSAFGIGNDGTAFWLGRGDGSGPYDNPEQRPLAERCLLGFGSTQGPPMLPVLYNNHKRIVQGTDHVMILVEMVHDARIVRLDSEHAPDDVRKWLGDSIGWWEGDTLVVDTTNFTDKPGLYGASRDLHVVERFTRLDENNLRYEFTVDDPNVWQGSWTGSYNWPATKDHVYEYACHEGNYALGGVLRGARLLEAEALAEN
jgi:hypothetical protein